MTLTLSPCSKTPMALYPKRAGAEEQRWPRRYRELDSRITTQVGRREGELSESHPLHAASEGVDTQGSGETFETCHPIVDQAELIVALKTRSAAAFLDSRDSHSVLCLVT